MFSYLKAHHSSRLVLDPTNPDINMDDFKCYNWKFFYGDVKKLIPSNITPRLIGKECFIRAFVVAGFAEDSLTRRSRSGFLVMLNSACFTYGDNQSVLWNTTVPDSMLKKKTASGVSYHFVREGVSADE